MEKPTEPDPDAPTLQIDDVVMETGSEIEEEGDGEEDA